MNYSDILEARRQAQEQITLADQATRNAARLIAQRLRIASVDEWTLRDLKKELQNFNAVTGKWKGTV